jgi:hypothetical protein
MKILLTFRLARPELAARIAADPLLGKAMGPKPNAAVGFLFPKAFDAAGPVLPRLLEVCAGEHVSFLRQMACTEAEVAAAGRLEVMCRATIAQTPPDRRAMKAAYDAEPLQPSASRWPVRLPERAFLSKPVPPVNISHIDQWTGEYAVGQQACAALEASGLSGYELRPLLHGASGRPMPQGRHLGTRQLLPAALAPHPRPGLLTYAPGALEGGPDFARAAEPLGNWGTPPWVVSQGVRRWFLQAGLKGWGFQPVLEEGTAAHEEHARLWQAVLGLLDAHGHGEIAT